MNLPLSQLHQGSFVSEISSHTWNEQEKKRDLCIVFTSIIFQAYLVRVSSNYYAFSSEVYM